MRLLMIKALVVLNEDRAPSTVTWDAASSLPYPAPNDGGRGTPPRPTPRARVRDSNRRPSPSRRVLTIVDRWRYDGRWWEARELHRDYYLLELDGGTHLELFEEGGEWWAARASN